MIVFHFQKVLYFFAISGALIGVLLFFYMKYQISCERIIPTWFRKVVLVNSIFTALAFFLVISFPLYATVLEALLRSSLLHSTR